MKVLAIGNSFARNATQFLPDIAKDGGFDLTLGLADIGGCSLEKHFNLFEQCKMVPDAKPYNFSYNSGPAESKDLTEILKLEDWDYISLQQVSHMSWRAETYQPYLDFFIKLINEMVPGATILLHQTWAYRTDSDYFKDGDVDQMVMYNGICEAYAKYAAEYGLKIIPSGVGIQKARGEFSYKVDTTYDFENPSYPELPDQTESLITGYHWKTGNTPTGKAELGFDAIHCNPKGCYLGAAVWYEVLSGKKISDTSFLPEGVTEEVGAILKKAAHEAVVEFGGAIT